MSGEATNAVARVNAAEEVVADTEKAATEAKDLRDARSLELGKLLLEAKSLHASKETFDAFLDRFVVLQPSRAYDYIRIARGKTTAEELKKEQRERKAKSRKKKELAKSKPAEPLPDSVTNGSGHGIRRNWDCADKSRRRRRSQARGVRGGGDRPRPPLLTRS